MDVSTVIAIIGGIALLVGVFGGGIELKELKVPPINSVLRVISFIVGALLIMAAVIVSKPEFLNLIAAKPSGTVTLPTTDSTSTATEIPTFTETPNWAISFEYRFPAGFWSVGTHEYTLEGSCPNLKDASGIWTNTFDVAENAPLLPGDVYFRLGGLRDASLDAQTVERINPQQTTTAAWSLIEMPQSDAELAVRDCTVTITWDGGIPKQLTSGLPFQR